MEEYGGKTLKGNRIMSIIKGLSVGIMVLTLNACINPGIRNFNSIAELKPDELVVVGKIRVIPKIGNEEQDFTGTLGAKRAKNKFYLVFDSQLKPLKEYVSLGGQKNMAEVEMEKTFAIVVKRGKPLIYSGGLVSLGGQGNLMFPGGLKLKYGKNDKAVYIGTIEYHRNIYEEITKVELKNQYRSAQRLMQKKFGKRFQLRFKKPVLLREKR